MVPGSETVSPFTNANIRTHISPLMHLRSTRSLALHLIAEEGRGADGCYAPGLGDEWEMVCTKSPMWGSEGEAWSEDESVFSDGSREGNVGNNVARHWVVRAW